MQGATAPQLTKRREATTMTPTPAAPHIADERLLALSFKAELPHADEAAHLAACAACAGQLQQLRELATSLAIAAHSRPSAAALARAQALAATLPTPSLLQRATAWLRATPVVDTRRMATAGLRSLASVYRLLYTAETVEVELRVEQEQGGRRIDGELLPAGEQPPGPALVQLVRGDGATVAEAEAGVDGRFLFRQVAPGTYQLWVCFAEGADVVLDALEIA